MSQLPVRAIVEQANDACRRRDLAALCRSVKSLVPRVVHALQYELVAIAELAALDEELAYERWRALAGRVTGPSFGGGVATA